MTDTQPQPQGNNPSDAANTAHPDTYTLRSPAHLIASLPGTLGYYPTETVALINLHTRPDDPDTLDVGPYFCADIGSTDQLHDMLEQLPMMHHAATFAVVISRVPESRMVTRAIEELRLLADEYGPVIDACWSVSEVADGTPYRLAFENHPSTAEHWGWQDCFEAGTVASVIASPAMQPYIANGILPELDRVDTFEHFDPFLYSDAARCDAVAPRAYRRGAELADLMQLAPLLARQEIERACELFTTAPSVKVVDNDDGLVIDDVFASDADLELLAAVLSRGRLRDCLILDALDNPRGASATLLTIGRNFTGAIRANALCLWAIVAVSQRLYAWAGVALRCADDEVPGHSLSNLLLHVMLAGKAEDILDVSRRGSRDTWFELGG